MRRARYLTRSVLAQMAGPGGDAYAAIEPFEAPLRRAFICACNLEEESEEAHSEYRTVAHWLLEGSGHAWAPTYRVRSVVLRNRSPSPVVAYYALDWSTMWALDESWYALNIYGEKEMTFQHLISHISSWPGRFRRHPRLLSSAVPLRSAELVALRKVLGCDRETANLLAEQSRLASMQLAAFDTILANGTIRPAVVRGALVHAATSLFQGLACLVRLRALLRECRAEQDYMAACAERWKRARAAGMSPDEVTTADMEWRRALDQGREDV